MSLATDSDGGVVDLIATATASAGAFDYVVTAEVAAMERSWRELETRSVGTPFQRFDFYDAWLRHMGEGYRPLIVTARRAGRLVAVLPLVSRRIGPITIAEFAGGSHATLNAGLFDRFAWSATAPSIALGLRRAIADSGQGIDVVRLTYQPAEIGGRPNPFVDETSRPAPHAAYDLSLDGGFEGVLQRHKGSKKRRKIRSNAKGYEECGGYTVSRSTSADEAHEIIDVFLAQKAARLASQGLPNVFAKPGTGAFLHDLAARAHAPCGLDHPQLLVYALRTADGIGATGILHGFGGSVFLAMNSFAQDKYARLAPGDMTLFHMIEDTANRGVERFDFGIGDARYKRSWCDREIPLYETIIPLSATGSLAAGVIAMIRRGADTIRANPKLHRLAQRLRRTGNGEPEPRSAGDDGDD